MGVVGKQLEDRLVGLVDVLGIARQRGPAKRTGDFFVTPPATIYNLEAALRGVEVRSLDKAVTEFFQNARTGLLTATPADFVTAINAALSVDA